MRRLIVLVLMLALLPQAALASEAGATFGDNGTCVEADGTAGLSTGTGECITPADYDEMFSQENLSSVPSLTDPSKSVAQVYNVQPDVASDRPIGTGLVPVPYTFKQRVGLYQPL